ncbi:MAG: ScpA family protein [Lautropia sp.]|nr:ScpA family protein [Lautropia sp.]
MPEAAPQAADAASPPDGVPAPPPDSLSNPAAAARATTAATNPPLVDGGQPPPPPAADAAGPTDKPAPVADADLPVLARIHGEPLRRIPNDLYIPPDALEVLLDTFEGPLDLLLYLIRKQNFDILDIPMAKVTAQYLAYVDEIRSRNLELAAEYLLMAAMLIDIKSRMLLPVKKADSDEEVEDPRAELARRLLEYERIKYGAAQIDALPVVGRDFVRAQVHLDHTAEIRLPDVSADDLRSAFADVLRRARLVQRHQVRRESLSVREHMSVILRKLQTRRFAEFHELFEVGQGTASVVVTFVAMLELARESLLQITQAEAFAPIYVRLSYLPS